MVLDSGIGGLYTLKKLQKKMPNENFLFFMDKLHAPYGNKSAKKLNKIVCKNVQNIRNKYFIKAIILACNTISAVCYNGLKQQNQDLPIIKIEPFLDAKQFHNEPTLVLLTKNTAKFCENISKIANENNVFIKSFGNFAKLIDNANGNFDALLPYLKRELCKYVRMNIKNIVLGCTHYNYIKTELRSIFGDVKFFENSLSVATQCKKTLTASHMRNKSGKGRTIILSKL